MRRQVKELFTINNINVYIGIFIFFIVLSYFGVENIEKITAVIVPLAIIPFFNAELVKKGKTFEERMKIIVSTISFLIILLMDFAFFGQPTIKNINIFIIVALITIFSVFIYKIKLKEKIKALFFYIYLFILWLPVFLIPIINYCGKGV